MRDLQNELNQSSASWRLGSRKIQFGRLPALMGILNVTPDSFSDGGNFVSVERAVAHAMALVEAGADIIDVGGESTRPYSDPVSEKEEIERTVKVVEAITGQTDVPVSIDTSKAKVAWECLQAGAEIINDVTGLEGDSKMVSVAAESKAAVCAMHMQGNPQNMQDNPTYDNVVEEIFHYLDRRKSFLVENGIEVSRVCLDPGIGFGKTHQHNLDLIAGCKRFHDLGCPVLVGHSRKGFIAKILGDKEADRAAATAGVAVELARQGIQILRVHDVKIVKDTIQLFDAVGGIDGKTLRLDGALPGPTA